MDRTTSNGFVFDGSGHRIWVDQNELSGVDGTDVTAADMIGFQEELMGLIEGFGATPDGSNLKQVFAILKAVLNPAPVSYSTPGTYNWTCPAGVFSRRVRVWGGGGGGGGMGNSADGGGGGAAGGGYSEGVVTTVPGTTYVITVGAGGVAGVIGGNNGGSGASSSFSTLISATGGGGGTGYASGTGLGSAAPGAGSGGTTNVPGYVGQNAILLGGSYAGGCGGGANGSTNTWNAAAGGPAGAFPGGGGGGGARNQPGGTGAIGQVIVG